MVCHWFSASAGKYMYVIKLQFQSEWCIEVSPIVTNVSAADINVSELCCFRMYGLVYVTRCQCWQYVNVSDWTLLFQNVWTSACHSLSVLAICECVWLNLAVSECVNQCMSLSVSAGIRNVFEPVSECVVCVSAGDRYVCRTRSSQGFVNCAAECTSGQRRRWREKSMASARCPASPSPSLCHCQSNSYCLSFAWLFLRPLLNSSPIYSWMKVSATLTVHSLI